MRLIPHRVDRLAGCYLKSLCDLCIWEGVTGALCFPVMELWGNLWYECFFIPVLTELLQLWFI
jgi:hypothetical protein